MRAHDIMSSPAVTVAPDVSIREAAGLLSFRGFTALPDGARCRHPGPGHPVNRQDRLRSCR